MMWSSMGGSSWFVCVWGWGVVVRVCGGGMGWGVGKGVKAAMFAVKHHTEPPLKPCTRAHELMSQSTLRNET